MASRESLPFRRNCEGYFINNKGKVLAKDSGEGFIIFPGGGIEDSEDTELAMRRETLEETGIIPSSLKKLGVLKIVWDSGWMKTSKQKERYKTFQGDEMHFFTGIAEENGTEMNFEDSWKGEKFMDILEVIKAIEKSRPFDKGVSEYREAQLRYLKQIL